jgi:hypothetical protein
MKPRPNGFLAEDKIARDSEIFDYIRELHDYLWQFVRIFQPAAYGVVDDYVDDVLEMARATKELVKMPLELTEEEEQLVLKKRKGEAQKKQARELALCCIRTAHKYALWLEENGAGDTYSTFCDEFGYEAGLGEARSETWHTIHDIWVVSGLYELMKK